MEFNKAAVQYRKTHRRCRFCKHREKRRFGMVCYCTIKQKYIMRDVAALICRYYEPEKQPVEQESSSFWK